MNDYVFKYRPPFKYKRVKVPKSLYVYNVARVWGHLNIDELNNFIDALKLLLCQKQNNNGGYIYRLLQDNEIKGFCYYPIEIDNIYKSKFGNEHAIIKKDF